MLSVGTKVIIGFSDCGVYGNIIGYDYYDNPIIRFDIGAVPIKAITHYRDKTGQICKMTDN